MSFKFVAFDLDGTLLDTMSVYYETFTVLTERMFNKPVDTAAFKNSFNNNSTVDGFLTDYNNQNTPENCEKFITILNEELPRQFRMGINWMPTAKQTLLEVKKQYPIAILTSSIRPMVDIYNEVTELYSYVDTIITRTELGTTKRKPDPAGLLQLQQKFAMQPQDCLYVGNDDEDLEAAHNAGWKGALLRDERISKKSIDKADYLLEELSDLLPVLSV